MPSVEIGSEFHRVPDGEGTGIVFPKEVADFSLTFSGRTAIETILKNEHTIKKALLPSYCCDSMLEPFRKAGIEVSFFPVNYHENLKIDIEVHKDIDCILWCNYFGYSQQVPDLNEFVSRGGILIEDITHSFFSELPYHKQSQYLVASLRKWGPIFSGGYCARLSGQLIKKPAIEPPEEFVFKKRQMMKNKAEYLSGNKSIDKNLFLAGFEKSNLWLTNNYSGLKMDRESEKIITTIDIDAEKRQRVNNAKRLYQGIQTNDTVKFLFSKDKMECPLFVPLIILNGKRDAIRNALILHDIYCPVHWPHPKSDCESNIYDIELSLVCDQRYNENDMDYIVSIINECSRHM